MFVTLHRRRSSGQVLRWSSGQALRRCSGQALVEFAFVLPVMLVLVLGLIEIGRGFVFGVSVQEGARQAARLAASAAYDSTVTDSAVLGRLVAASAPALVGCPATAGQTLSCNGGTWQFTVQIVTGAGGTYSSLAAVPAGSLSGSEVTVTAAGSVALLPGFQTGAFGLSLPQIAVHGQSAMVIL